MRISANETFLRDLIDQVWAQLADIGKKIETAISSHYERADQSLHIQIEQVLIFEGSIFYNETQHHIVSREKGRYLMLWAMTWMLSHRKVKEAFLVCWDLLWPTKYFIQLPPPINTCCTSYPKWEFEKRNEGNTKRTICKHHQSFSWNCFQRYCASFCDGLSWSLSENLKHRPSWNAPALCNTSHPLNNSVF